MQIVVKMSHMQVSSAHNTVLATHSLGSCIALTLHDPDGPRGGMIHCMLPSSEIDPSHAAANPCMFVDTGVARMVAALEADRKSVV